MSIEDMRSIEDIAVDVFNGSGPHLDPEEQNAFLDEYGEEIAGKYGIRPTATNQPPPPPS